VFPESFIPAYPAGLGFGTVVGSRTEAGRDQFREYHEQSVDVPGPETDTLSDLARKHGMYIVMGVTERDAVSKTLYCTLLYFSPVCGLMGKHRKLKPTAAERLVWGEGDSSTLSTFDTAIGIRGSNGRCAGQLEQHDDPHCTRGALLRDWLQSANQKK
jgi:nitrilase